MLRQSEMYHLPGDVKLKTFISPNTSYFSTYIIIMSHQIKILPFLLTKLIFIIIIFFSLTLHAR